MQVFHLETAEAALRAAGEALNPLFKKYRHHPILFLSSGGSSLQILDTILVHFLGRQVTITMSDDRFSRDADINNYRLMTQLNFYTLAQSAHCKFISTIPLPKESVEAFGKRFDAALKAWRLDNPQGKVIMTQGMGPDNHTCGMLPFPENPSLFRKLFDTNEQWAVGYYAPGKNEFSKRITVTLPFLREQVDHTIFYACGEAKRDALIATLAKSGDVATTPARIIRDMNDVQLFTDVLI